MTLSGNEIRDLHSRLGLVEDLIAQRRAIYSAAIEFVGGPTPPETSVEELVVENPAVRRHLGAVLGGVETFDRDELRSVDQLVVEACVVHLDGVTVRVASSGAAPARLSGATERIRRELSRHGDEARIRVLVAGDSAFDPAYRRVIEGVQLALALDPELVGDLLPHVALVAVLVQDGSAGRLGSASAREFPGLVMVPEPRAALEVAEAVVHEGAHQKFFDLALTRQIFGADLGAAPSFRPSWAAIDAPPWPIEQAFAACHAYTCLAVLADAAKERGLSPLPLSLLPMARVRASEIGDWLVARASHLGADGAGLLQGLTGAPPAMRSMAAVGVIDLKSQPGDVVRTIAGRTLTVRSGAPVDLFWTSAVRV